MEDLYKKFGKYYDKIYCPTYNYKQECNDLENLFKKYCEKSPENILDIGCGTGSHAIELCRRGFKVTGIDISPVMIKQAKKKAQAKNMDCDFLVQDMRELNFNFKFDCAICMFGSFGYLTTKKDLGRFLGRLKKNLKKKSLFLFEFWNAKGAVKEFKSWNKAKDEKGNITVIRLNESRLDEKTNIAKFSMEFIVYSGSEIVDSFTEVHKLRCFSVSEISKILDEHGFDLLATYNKDFKTQALESGQPSAFNIFAVAKTS
ncbi:MAG: class I SAM-dependent methyltransferase [Thermoplasmata archaeon]|nr:MAG: class I SAM-dependent methyltransferase [Thermoplasmata archaeon]